MARRPLRNVAALALPGVAPFELGVVCEVFAVDRSAQGLPRFDFAISAERPGLVPTSVGFAVQVTHGLDRLAEADLVAVPACAREPISDDVAQALRDVLARGGRLLSVCTGAFALAEAGVLDGRACTTHWMYADELASKCPQARVDPAVLYVEDGPVITSAGTAAGIDACLYVVRCEFGAEVAAAFARRMVMPPHRDGGQAQFLEAPVAATPADTLEPLLAWMAEHPDQNLTVEVLARRAHLSPRTFARRFKAETGTTPLHWLVGQRVLLAQRLLETTDLSLEQVAARCGFGTAPVLRHHFLKRRGTTPQAYRRTFRQVPA